MVPSTVRPAGSATVCRLGAPAIGPTTENGVFAVIRRL
jgi:hypothetical protein